MRSSSRVDRLGKFLPIGRLFTLGSFWEITEVPQILWYFFQWYKLRINFDKKWVGLCFGQNSSGHPVQRPVQKMFELLRPVLKQPYVPGTCKARPKQARLHKM
jgi:hypothetical protein